MIVTIGMADAMQVPFTDTWKKMVSSSYSCKRATQLFKVFLECAKIYNDMHMRLKEVVGGFFAGSKQ